MQPTSIKILFEKIEAGETFKSFGLPKASAPQVAEALLKEAEERNSSVLAPLKAEILNLSAKGKLDYSRFQSSGLKLDALFRQAVIRPDDALLNLAMAGDPETEYQVLLSVAEEDSWALTEYLKAHPLKDTQKFKALILKLAASDPAGVLSGLSDFNLYDPEFLFELGQNLIQTYPLQFSRDAEPFYALSKQEQLQLFWLGFRNSSDIINTSFGIKVGDDNPEDPYFKAACYLNYKDFSLSKNLLGSIPLLESSASESYKRKFLQEALFLLATGDTAGLEWLKNSCAISCFFQHKAYEVLDPVFSETFKSLREAGFKASFKRLSEGRSRKIASLALVMALFETRGIRPPNTSKIFVSLLKDKIQLQIVLKASILILNSPELNPSQKQTLLHTLFEKNLIQRAQAIQSVFALRKAKKFKEFEDPEVLLDRLFQKLLQKLKIQEKDYSKLILYPKGLPYFAVYASRLALLDDDNLALKNYALFIQSLTDDTLCLKRNDPVLNPNLSILTPDQLRFWLSPSPLKIAMEDGFIFENTSDPMDLFLCGNAAASCLRLDGNQEYNKGLLGYLLNGAVRLLVVKNNEGKIKARTVIRVLTDASNHPVIVQEDPYTAEGFERFEEILHKGALDLKERLGVPLLREEGDEPFQDEVRSKGSLGAYEYSDLYYTQNGEVSHNGKFLVKGLYSVLR